MRVFRDLKLTLMRERDFSRAFADEWAIASEHLTLFADKQIGSGAFAKVFLAELRGPKHEFLKANRAKFLDPSHFTTVAVKYARDASSQDR